MKTEKKLVCYSAKRLNVKSALASLGRYWGDSESRVRPTEARRGVLEVEQLEERFLLAGNPLAISNIDIVQVESQQLAQFGDAWSYQDNGIDQGTAWRATEFDDSTWATGAGPLGYDCEFYISHEQTTLEYGSDPDNRHVTTYFRREFTVDDPSQIDVLWLRLIRDDGAAVYLNGVEIFRDGLSADSAYDDLAQQVITGHGEDSRGEFTPIDGYVRLDSLPAGTLKAGKNVFAVEIHNSSIDDCDMSFDLSVRGLSESLRAVADFTGDIAPSSVQASDFLIDGSIPVINAVVVDGNTVEFILPEPLAAGSHALEISAGSILGSDDTPIDQFSDDFLIASDSQYRVNNSPRLQLGDAPLVGFSGSETDQVDILWQTVPVGTGTEDTLLVDYRPAGSQTWLPVNDIVQEDVNTDGRVIHTATILGLAYDASYEYRVRHFRGDVAIETFDGLFNTRLAAGDTKPFSFAAYGDAVDYTEIQNFRLVQSQINQVDPDFVLLLGDNDQRSGSFDDLDYRFDQTLSPEAAEWNSQHVDYLGFGNHDIVTDHGAPTEFSYSVPIPVEGINAHAEPSDHERDEHNYSFDYGNIHFVTFDTNSYRSADRLEEQLAYVEADLAASTAQWNIVYGHHPVAGTPSFPQSPGMTYYQQVVPRLREAGVDLFLTGHSHTFSWTYPLLGENSGEATFVLDEDKDYAQGDGLIQVVAGTGGFHTLTSIDPNAAGAYWPSPGDYSVFPFVASGYDLGEFDLPQNDTPSEYGFARIDASTDQLVVNYVAADDGAVIDSFTITARPEPIVVNSVHDSIDGSCEDGDGTCMTLRAAIEQANATPGPTRIEFDLPDAGLHTIELTAPLPAITETVVIDATTQSGFDSAPVVEIDGRNITGDGLYILADHSEIYGLSINNFSGDGIEIRSGNNVIDGNFIGVDLDGSTDQGNDGYGIQIYGSNNQIGGDRGNVISGNGASGVYINGSDYGFNSISGNLIGTAADGLQAIPNWGHGVYLRGTYDNTIGGDSGNGNVISGNTGSGIAIIGASAVDNEVLGNSIGVNSSGNAPLGNLGNGIVIHNGTRNQIGGSASGQGNLISGNGVSGISVVNSDENVIQGNTIGADFEEQREFFIFDPGSETGVVNHGGLISGNPQEITVAGDNVFFYATLADGSEELHVSDGTREGTRLLKNLSGVVSSMPRDLTAFGDEIYFTAIIPNGERELFKSDGTADGTVLVRDLSSTWQQTGPSVSSDPLELTPVGDILFFSALQSNGKRELYASDGSSGSGTGRVKNVNGVAASSNPRNLTAVGSSLFFTATLGGGQEELFTSDGTINGTHIVKNLSGSVSAMPQELTQWGSKIFFTALQSNGERELYWSDGTTTARVTNLHPGFSSHPRELTVLGEYLYFVADGADGQTELYRTDGTENGTSMVVDLSGSFSSDPMELTVVGEEIFFSAQQSNGERELFRTKGSTAIRVTNLHLGLSSDPRNLVSVGSHVYFSATTQDGQIELYRSDGTADGTQLAGDFSGVTSSQPKNLTADASGRLYFSSILPVQQTQFGNEGRGVLLLNSSDTVVGGTSEEGASNVIGMNQGGGIAVSGSQSGNLLLSNSLFQNVGAGIKFLGNQSTQLAPTLVEAQLNTVTNELTVQYNFDGMLTAPDLPLRIEFFLTDADSQEGLVFIGDDEYTAVDLATGQKSLVLTTEVFLSPGLAIVATATNLSLGTSEFSPVELNVEFIEEGDELDHGLAGITYA